MPIIEVDGLAKTFRSRERATGLASSIRSFVAPQYREREAVKRISFALEPGEVLAFIGPNGAGKSTSIKMLTGILYPTAGKAQVLDLIPWKQRHELSFHISLVGCRDHVPTPCHLLGGTMLAHKGFQFFSFCLTQCQLGWFWSSHRFCPLFWLIFLPFYHRTISAAMY